ncbi:MAG: alanine:cation symporter family protein, partial [Treponemataceae bacterium]|nr:alanine:cation symporter family protein [Treponemataceae bacterium]
GHVLGGPFYTIEKGMGKNWKWLAMLFAIFGVLAGLLGIGTMTQINGITSAVNMAFDPDSAHIAFTIGETAYTWATVIGGIVVTVCAALVILGGLQRISKVAEKTVPAMAIIYVFLGLSVIIMNATRIPAAFALIFKSAFGFKAVAGGAVGWTVKQIADSMQKGIARGIFSNEAGLGSAPIAAAPVQTNEPVEQGLVNMTGTVIDTLIVCTMTGLAIVLALADPAFFAQYQQAGWKGVELTANALSFDLGGDGISVQFLLMLCLAFFAFTTILGWDYYSEKCLEYVTGGRMKLVLIYRVLYILAIAIGPYFTVNAVFTIADITNGLMAIPNCVSLIVLSGIVAKETKTYFEKYPKF